MERSQTWPEAQGRTVSLWQVPLAKVGGGSAPKALPSEEQRTRPSAEEQASLQAAAAVSAAKGLCAFSSAVSL